jgi:hypothetical protein
VNLQVEHKLGNWRNSDKLQCEVRVSYDYVSTYPELKDGSFNSVGMAKKISEKVKECKEQAAAYKRKEQRQQENREALDRIALALTGKPLDSYSHRLYLANSKVTLQVGDGGGLYLTTWSLTEEQAHRLAAAAVDILSDTPVVTS